MVQRAILVDADGYFMAAIQWRDEDPAPRFDKKLTKGTRPKMTMLRDPYAIENVNEMGRWDFTPVREPVDPNEPDGEMRLVRSGTWLLPTQRYWLVDTSTGQCVGGGRAYWPDRLPIEKPGQKWITVEPPSLRGRRPLWNDEAGEWQWPTRVLLINDAGEVANVVLENPMPQSAKVEVPPGWERFDDLPGTPDWPTMPDGTPVGKGDRRGGPGGDWERPGPPQAPGA